MRRIDQKTEASVCKFYDSKLSIDSISKLAGISKASVHRILVRNQKERVRSSGPINKIRCNENYFEIVDTPDKAYWLGFIAADGSIQQRKNGSLSLRIKLSRKDVSHLHLFLEDIQSSHTIVIGKQLDRRTGKSHDVAKICIVRAKLVRDLIANGINYNKARFTEKPDIPERFHRYFLRGYFDGDGCWSVRRNQLAFAVTSCSKQILEFFRDWLEVGDKTKNIYRSKTQHAYRITYEGNRLARKIYDKLYDGRGPIMVRKEQRAARLLSKFV